MQIFRSTAVPMRQADSATFVGPAFAQRLAEDSSGMRVALYRVTFEDGGRTNWHTHSGPQWLFVLEGRIRVQREGEPPHDLAAGDAAVIGPGEKHWHGAAPGAAGTHLAVNVQVTTTWMEPVADDTYLAVVSAEAAPSTHHP